MAFMSKWVSRRQGGKGGRKGGGVEAKKKNVGSCCADDHSRPSAKQYEMYPK